MRPRDDRGQRDADAGEHQQHADDQAGFEGDVAEPAFEAFVFGEEAFGDGEDLGGDAEEDELEAEENGGGHVGERVDAEVDVAERALCGQQPGHHAEADDHEREAGVEEEPARRIHQQEAEVAPAVAPGFEVRRAAAAILLERGGDLGHLLAEQRGFDDHLAGELHAGGAEGEALVGVFAEGADAAVEVADGRVEEARGR